MTLYINYIQILERYDVLNYIGFLLEPLPNCALFCRVFIYLFGLLCRRFKYNFIYIYESG